MSILIETQRFIIRPLAAQDAEGMFLMDSDPLVHKYVGQNPVRSIAQIEKVIEYINQQYAQNGIGRWAVIHKDSNQFAGWTGFKLMDGPINNHANFYDFGYRFAQRFWGQGAATETGWAALQYGIKLLKPKDVYAMTDIDNAASIRVLQKLGFKLLYAFPYNDAAVEWRYPGQATNWFHLDVATAHNIWPPHPIS